MLLYHEKVLPMNYEIGDVVLCPPSGPHAGPRVGKIKRIDTNSHGEKILPVLIKYIDYPKENPDGAWVHPIKKL